MSASITKQKERKNRKAAKRKVIIVQALIGLLAGSVFFASIQGKEASSADEIAELKTKIGQRRAEIDKLRAERKQYEKQLASLRSRSVTLENQISLLDYEIKRTELDIKLLEVQVAEAELEIKKISFEIGKTEEGIQKQKEKIAFLLRQIYKQDNIGIVELLLTKDSLSEFFNEVMALENIQANVKDAVDDLKVTKLKLEQSRQALESKKVSLEKYKGDLEYTKEKYEENQNLKRNLLAETRQSERRFQRLVSKLKREQNLINAEIKELESSIRRKMEEEDRKKLQSQGKLAMIWPVPSRYITSYFKDEDYPYRYIFEHPAIDIRARHGTPVRAAESGYVARARFCSTPSCYQYVMIIHNNGISTVYGHLSKILVQEDQFVSQGDVIGLSGATPGTIGAGRLTTGPHFHLEVRKNGIPVDPLLYLP